MSDNITSGDGTPTREIDIVIDALRGGRVPVPKIEKILDAASRAKQDAGVRRVARGA